MLSILDDPAIRARVPAIGVEQYHRMFELGALAPNIELIRGALIEKLPKSPLHASIVTQLFIRVLNRTPAGLSVRSEQPLTFADSEPEPDVAVVRGSDADYFRSHPTSAEVIIEVAVTSEALDRFKLQLYAEAGVKECWLVLAGQGIVERHTEPGENAYGKVERAVAASSLESTILPGLTLSPASFFPG